MLALFQWYRRQRLPRPLSADALAFSLFFSFPPEYNTSYKLGSTVTEHHSIADTLSSVMARGNQRDKAREKTQKEQAAQVRLIPLSAYLCCVDFMIKTEKRLTFLVGLEKEE